MSSVRVDSGSNDTGNRLVVEGDLDIAVMDALTELIDAAPQGSTVEVDLRAVSFMDSTGLRALLQGRATGREMVLVNPRPEVRRVLEIAEVVDLFTIRTSAM
ncbi:MAG TPA: STAS domain-containing protein [Microthrixaceae bacterium]|nr:STAS domain-containing protein [Microthrixaceae bacterium]HNI36247.1 STAS domain-containing protein [Microthrixaceae bacterium]